MKKYIFTKNFLGQAGMFPNGGLRNVLFKTGDIIEGTYNPSVMTYNSMIGNYKTTPSVTTTIEGIKIVVTDDKIKESNTSKPISNKTLPKNVDENSILINSFQQLTAGSLPDGLKVSNDLKSQKIKVSNKQILLASLIFIGTLTFSYFYGKSKRN